MYSKERCIKATPCVLDGIVEPALARTHLVDTSPELHPKFREPAFLLGGFSQKKNKPHSFAVFFYPLTTDTQTYKKSVHQ